MIKKLRKIHYFHYISCAILVVCLLFTFLVFRSTFIRLGESFTDLWTSILFYFKALIGFKMPVNPTLNNFSQVPWTPIFGLPETWEEFVVLWHKYWEVWATGDNVAAYFQYLSQLLFNLSRILLLAVVPVVIILVVLFQRYLSIHNNNYNEDTKPLRFAKWFGSKVYIPVKKWILSFVHFFCTKGYFKAFVFIWALNFNVPVMIIEFFAFYFYFVVSFDLTTLYKQAYKLFCDLSVSIAFIPTWLWCIFGYMIFSSIRKNIGYRALNHFERMNRGFINERPISTMICGTMGKKKTTTLTDIALSLNAMFRDEAFDRLLKNDMKFPNFPWINLENIMKIAIREHRVYNLATVRKYIRHLSFCFATGYSEPELYHTMRRHLRKHYGLSYDNLCFNYDFERYGLYYNDELKLENLWSVIETYAQLYFIYVVQSSLIISNLSIRTDETVSDLGNLPLRDSDFFQRNASFVDEMSRYSHIIDFDAMRLGKKVDEDSVFKDSFEFGVVVITEVGKERKNAVELRETKKKEDVANQRNDGFNDWLKMIRHSATVDNYPFVRVVTDEQRPESWGADARDLCDIVYIKESGDTQLAMPFFALAELIHSFVYDKFISVYVKYRYIRADNTLVMYLLKKFVALFHQFYTRIYNTFGYCTLRVQVESGTQDGEVKEKKYYLMSKKIYSKRFSTDCFSDFFAVKAMRSPAGMDDLPEYGTDKATFEELQQQKSYFISDLTNKPQ